MKTEILRKGNVVTRLTVNKERITIKLAEKDDNQETIQFLETIGAEILKNPLVRVTMRGALEGSKIEMFDDLKAFSLSFQK